MFLTFFQLETCLNFSVYQDAINDSDRKIFEIGVIEKEGQNIILFFYTVQSVSTLNKGTLLF
jgi:hypothetical protein